MIYIMLIILFWWFGNFDEKVIVLAEHGEVAKDHPGGGFPTLLEQADNNHNGDSYTFVGKKHFSKLKDTCLTLKSASVVEAKSHEVGEWECNLG